MKVSSDLWKRVEELVAEAVGDPDRAEAVAEAAAILRDHHRLAARARAVLGETGPALAAERAPAYGARKPYPYDPALITPKRSLHEIVRILLEAVQMPMHVRDIAGHVRGSGWTSPRGGADAPGKLEAQLSARLMKHPDIFERVAPNTFGLVGWPPYEAPMRRKPRFPLWDCPPEERGTESWAEWIGDHPEAPIIDPDNSPWS